jgi:aminoglycoside 6'-N-acetyltransferase I
VVAPARQGQGIGRGLVADVEAQARARGGLTILLGTDDVRDTTSLFGVNLYDDLPRHLATIVPKRGHPFTFYRKLGYTVCGCVPDANGIGKPNIQMAKRLT